MDFQWTSTRTVFGVRPRTVNTTRPLGKHKVNSTFARLRSDPQFAGLPREIGLAAAN